MSETENKNYTFTNYKDTEHSMAIGPELAEKIQDFMYKQNAEAVRDADEYWEEDGLFDSLTHLVNEAPSGKAIFDAGTEIIEMLLKKNVSYGNSALMPLRLFSNASVEEQILIRVDDKLSRLKNNQSYPGDNDIDDLIGYLILLKVARRISTE